MGRDENGGAAAEAGRGGTGRPALGGPWIHPLGLPPRPPAGRRLPGSRLAPALALPLPLPLLLAPKDEAARDGGADDGGAGGTVLRLPGRAPSSSLSERKTDFPRFRFIGKSN